MLSSVEENAQDYFAVLLLPSLKYWVLGMQHGKDSCTKGGDEHVGHIEGLVLCCAVWFFFALTGIGFSLLPPEEKLQVCSLPSNSSFLNILLWRSSIS